LGATPDKLFATFSEQPMAAASLGQVHRATLEDGRVVAVKVQYPGIAEALTADLDNLALVGKAVTTALRIPNAQEYFREIRDELLLELDYRREARLAQGFATAARSLPDLRVPDVVLSRSAERVLTLELLEGRVLKDVLAE